MPCSCFESALSTHLTRAAEPASPHLRMAALARTLSPATTGVSAVQGIFGLAGPGYQWNWLEPSCS
jgi:hypothetical protein